MAEWSAWFTEWLNSSTGDLGIALDDLIRRLVLALLLGAVVAAVHVVTQRKPPAERVSFATTLLLLTVLIAMVTMIIGNSIARAFSLAGALAIIRFRTVVEDTRDTAFVIFAVVAGMGAGAGLPIVPIAGVPIVATAALLLSLWGLRTAPAAGDYALALRLGIGRDPTAAFRETFGKHLERSRLSAMTTARQGAALDLTYQVRLRRGHDAVAFVNELNKIEGVQSVELRQL